MHSVLNARKLAEYIKALNFDQLDSMTTDFPKYSHIGALYTNIVLQAGLNYKSVVEPRVTRMLVNYPTAATLSGLEELIVSVGLETMIRWKHEEKLYRFKALVAFSKENGINTCAELAEFLRNDDARLRFLELKGFGFKTLDYTLKLLNFDTVAVDRHIYNFLQLAGLPEGDYFTTKRLVEYAADLLQVPRSAMDYSIWRYMSMKMQDRPQAQLALNF